MSEGFRHRRAGQFALLGIDEADRPHPFTLSGAPEDQELKMTIKNVGDYTGRIHQLKLGAKVTLQGPYGKFCSSIDEKPLITMIAGGIGITPFLSVLRHFIHQEVKRSVRLIWANNTEEDFFSLLELANMKKKLEMNITLVSLKGFASLNDFAERKGIVLRQGYLAPETFPSDLGESAIYLCGSPAMQDYALDQLKNRGVDPVTVEKEKITSLGR